MRAARRGVRRWLVPFGTVLALAAVGCTSAFDEADARFAAGDYRAAAAAYEATMADGGDGRNGWSCGEPMFRLALVYTLPESSVHRPDRAAELLTTLSDRCPQSPWGDAARLLLAGRAERRRLTADLAVERARVDALETRLDALADDRAADDDARAADAASEAALAREIDGLRRQVVDLQSQIEARDLRLAELENELRRLKEIDLKTP